MSDSPILPRRCPNGHDVDAAAQFCGRCGAGVNPDDVSSGGGPDSVETPLTQSSEGDQPRNRNSLWTLGVVLIVALAAVAIAALVVHSGSHQASPKTSNIPSTTQPATSTSVPSTTTSTPTTSPAAGTGPVPMFVDCVYFNTPPQPA